jgi:hypothetical protein
MGVKTFPQLEAFLRQQGYGADELAAHGIVVHPTEIAPPRLASIVRSANTACHALKRSLGANQT